MAMSSRNEASKKVVEETVRLYSSILSFPINEKQLSRPTFKFIQDLIKSLITETRILREVFNPSDFETEKKNWDKQMKTEFIQRLIDHTAKNDQPVVGCIAAKVVAGLDPNKINELLQAIARLAIVRLHGPDGHSGRSRTFTRASSNAAPNKSSTVAQRRLKPTIKGSRANVIEPARKVTERSRIITGAIGRATSSKVNRGDSEVSAKSSLADEGPRKCIEVASSARNSLAADLHGEPSQDANYENNSGAIKDVLQLSKEVQRNEVIISSESEIYKHTQQLRTDLKHLRGTVNEINQMNSILKKKFLAQSL